MKALATAAVVIGALAILTDAGSAYYAHGRRWAAGTVTMHLQMGSSSGSLLDGTTNWDAVTEGALSTWNSYLNGVTLRGQRGSTASIGEANGVNNVIWDEDVFGDPFGDSTLAVTTYRYRVSDSRLIEADVVFNTKFSWNSYRGNLRNASAGGRLQDLRRVALHEFGHAIGLDHPDEHGQSVSAIMNSRISNLDALQSDDVSGAQSVYGAVTVAPAASDTLASGGRLTAGQTLVSSNRRFRLLYQSDGNLVLYDDTDRTAPWATNTGGTTPGYVQLQGDGNLVVYEGQGAARFASNTPGNANSRLVLQNDGNLVLYASNGQPTWDRYR
jgi:hypothetical protein